MENASDLNEDAGEGNRQAAVIDQGNPSPSASDVVSGNSLITFRIEVEKGALAAEPSPGSLYFEWSIMMDPIDIDGPEELEDQVRVEIGQSTSTINNEGNVEPESGDDDEEDEEILPDLIGDVEESGRALDDAETPHWLPSLSINSPPPRPNTICLPDPGPLKGYEYSEFKPIPVNENSSVDVYMFPTQSDASAVLTDLRNILHLPRNTGRGYKNPEFDLWRTTGRHDFNAEHVHKSEFTYLQ